MTNRTENVYGRTSFGGDGYRNPTPSCRLQESGKPGQSLMRTAGGMKLMTAHLPGTAGSGWTGTGTALRSAIISTGTAGCLRIL